MPTIVKRRRKAKPTTVDQSLSELLNELMAVVAPLDQLVDALDSGSEPDVNDIAKIAGVCEQIGDLAPKIAGWLGSASAPSAAALYSRPAGNRRIMFLELVAWGVVHIEQQKSSADLGRFERELVANRIREWRDMPWPGAAKDEERFERHVLGLARAFTSDGEYPLRR